MRNRTGKMRIRLEYRGLNVALIELRLPQLACRVLHIWLDYRVLEQILALITHMLRKIGLLIFIVLNDYCVSERVLDFILTLNLDLCTIVVPLTLVAF